jgi:hypothetical protein
MINAFAVAGLAAALLLAGERADARTPGPESERAARLVAQVLRADYEGDRAALGRLEGELTPFADRDALGARTLYWRGFALWRRAINGANENVPAADMRRDLEQAVSRFEAALAKDPSFADAELAAGSSMLFLVYLDRADSARAAARVPSAVRALQHAKATDPGNPRLMWVLGATEWYRAAGRDSGERAAMAIYERGLKSARARPRTAADPLEPAWGEPELLMSMAWSQLHRRVPDLDAADRLAHEALALVPHWHYVRDILIPQISDARAKRATTPTAEPRRSR